MFEEFGKLIAIKLDFSKPSGYIKIFFIALIISFFANMILNLLN